MTFIKPDPTNSSAVTVTAPTFFKGLPSTFTVPLITGDISAAGIIAYQFNILYDSSVIDPYGANFGCSPAGTITGAAGLSVTCNVFPDGTLRVSASGAGTLSGGGTLLNLTFRTDDLAAPSSSSPLDFHDAFFFNSGGGVIISTVDGRVTLVGPTAAGATISGRIISADGNPIAHARIILTDIDGVVRGVRSNQFGCYRFTEITVGRTYVIQAVAKNHTFTPRVLNFVEDLTDFDLAAETNENFTVPPDK